MPIAHILCNVENFRSGAWPDDDGEDVFVDEMRVQGWFLAHTPVSSMSWPSTTTPSAALRCRRPVSRATASWTHHGSVFGARARASRFLGAWPPLPNTAGGPGPARLRVTMTDGNLFEQALGEPLIETARHAFSAEDAALVMEFESIGDCCELGLVQRRSLPRRAWRRRSGLAGGAGERAR